MAANLCRRRARLYAQQLADTSAYLRDLVHKEPFRATDAQRLAPALADRGLIDALEEILNIYVVYGVARDLQRLRGSKVLFGRDTSDLPLLDQVLPSDGSAPSYTGAGHATDPDVTPEEAYDRYFTWYIDPPDVSRQADESKSGVEAFYERYPLLAYAVRTVTQHHQANIKLACQRIAADWNEIQVAFFPGWAAEQLVRIRTTGNDFHKGGKQVLILTFLLDDGSRRRVVYKPSSVEIDCRIVGDSDIVNDVAPQRYRQEASLTELVNKFSPPRKRPEGFTSRPLPTYRILPYNRDSVPDSYGYIEFLTHEPDPDVSVERATNITAAVGAAVMKRRPTDGKQSDWIIEDPRDGQVFYHAFGGLMAMALSVSLSDLHLQNVIVHDRLPHLIDLEEALKRPMTNIKETYLIGPTGALGRFDDPEGNVLKIDNDRTSKLSAAWMPGIGRPAACALYLSHGASAPAEPVGIGGRPGGDGERNAKALARGFIDVAEAIASPAGNDAVKAWTRRLDRTIARFVTLATAEYANSCRNLYLTYCENSVDSLRADSGWESFKVPKPEGGDAFFFADSVTAKRDRWKAKRDVGPTWNPFFAVEHPDHAWRDYLNCDVPSFYHLLGSCDLLNARGGRVNVSEAVEWQDENISGRSGLPQEWQPKNGRYDLPERPNGEYLPERPIDMVVDQLQNLRDAWSTAAGRRKYLADALSGVGGLKSDVAQFAKGILVSRPERPVTPTGSRR